MLFLLTQVLKKYVFITMLTLCCLACRAVLETRAVAAIEWKFHICKLISLLV